MKPLQALDPYEPSSQVNGSQLKRSYFSASQTAASYTASSQPPKPLRDVFSSEFHINDVPVAVRNLLTKTVTLEEISCSTGTIVTCQGSYIPPDVKDKYPSVKPLHLLLQASKKQNIDCAIQRINILIQQAMNLPKYKEKVLIGLESAPASFDVRGKVLGPGGANLQYITNETGALVTLRGRGSGFIEPTSGMESIEPLHLCVEHNKYDVLQAGRQLAFNLIETVQQEWYNCQQQQSSHGPPMSHANQGPTDCSQRPFYELPRSEQIGGDFDSLEKRGENKRAFENRQSGFQEGSRSRSRSRSHDRDWGNEVKRFKKFRKRNRPKKSFGQFQGGIGSSGGERGFQGGNAFRGPGQVSALQGTKGFSGPSNFKKSRWDNSVEDLVQPPVVKPNAPKNPIILGVVLEQKIKLEQKLKLNQTLNQIQLSGNLSSMNDSLRQQERLLQEQLRAQEQQKILHQQQLQALQQRIAQRDLEQKAQEQMRLQKAQEQIMLQKSAQEQMRLQMAQEQLRKQQQRAKELLAHQNAQAQLRHEQEKILQQQQLMSLVRQGQAQLASFGNKQPIFPPEQLEMAKNAVAPIISNFLQGQHALGPPGIISNPTLGQTPPNVPSKLSTVDRDYFSDDELEVMSVQSSSWNKTIDSGNTSFARSSKVDSALNKALSVIENRLKSSGVFNASKEKNNESDKKKDFSAEKRNDGGSNKKLNEKGKSKFQDGPRTFDDKVDNRPPWAINQTSFSNDSNSDRYIFDQQYGNSMPSNKHTGNERYSPQMNDSPGRRVCSTPDLFQRRPRNERNQPEPSSGYSRGNLSTHGSQHHTDNTFHADSNVQNRNITHEGYSFNQEYEDPEKKLRRLLRYRVAVLNRTGDRLTQEDSDEIKVLIYEALQLLPAGQQHQIEYVGLTSKDYLYVLMPFTLEGMQWLVDMTYISGSRGKKYTLFPYDDIYNKHRVRTFVFNDMVPAGQTITPEKVVEELGRLNFGLNVDLWKIAKHNVEEKGLFVMLLVDRLSFLHLKKLNWKPDFMYNRLNVKPIQKDGTYFGKNVGADAKKSKPLRFVPSGVPSEDDDDDDDDEFVI